MELLSPGALILLGLVPVTAGLYAWTLSRRRRYAVRYSSLSLLRAAVPASTAWRRHAPVLLFLLALGSLAVATARPATVAWLPVGRTTIILAIDTSRSMCANDIAPNRMEAAKLAARKFVQDQQSHTQMGLVAFAGFAELVQPPTDDEELLLDAINRLSPEPRTAIGSAILEAINAIAEVDPSVAPVADAATLEPPFRPEETRVHHVIVLLTDGANNVGPMPSDAARQAAARGVRVYTIGFGTQLGSIGRLCNNEYGDTVEFGQQFYPEFPGAGSLRGIDELELREVADLTGGAYYPATSAGGLQQVFAQLPITVLMEEQVTEISAAFIAVALTFLMLALILGWAWQPVV